MMQNNIRTILNSHALIPVVTIGDLSEIDSIYSSLKAKNVACIEITLRTEASREAIKIFKEKYGSEFKVGVGTVVNIADIEFCVDAKVDFIVTPGLAKGMVDPLEQSGIPFITGVSTPSEIIQGMEYGWNYFKFFPANLFGGIAALKTYGTIFPKLKFCPTGGINETNFTEFLALDNVVSVGGSWLIK